MKISLITILLFASLNAFNQSKPSVQNVINKGLTYSFSGGELFIIISSDSTIYWRDDSKPKEAHERSKTIHINDHTIMTSWYEADKTFVTLLSDFEKMKVSGMVCWADGRFYPMEGVIKLNR